MSGTIATSDQKPKPRPASGGHTLSMTEQPARRMRICQVFARRAYNIDSLVVSQGRDPRFSRLTLGISGDPAGLDQIIKQCAKLVDVIHCTEHTPADAGGCDMVLVKVRAEGGERRTEVLQIIEHFGGKTVDLTENSMIARIEGDSEKVDSAIRLLSNYEIIETVRTGSR
ncbi:MAG: acetolactate synthase small subunit [Akkermansiaceae bacterium]|nr:acetolactate synthase small subunit [Akkermansiaceae bacterium]